MSVQDKACVRQEGSARRIDAVILGLNDALVELTGALAGFTISFADNKLIALAGLTTGVAATFSMASADYLATKNGHSLLSSLKSALATGVAYIVTTALLLSPYLALSNPFAALGVTIALAVAIIFVFTLVVSRIRCSNFKGDFVEMLSISCVVAFLCFIVGWGANKLWGLEAG